MLSNPCFNKLKPSYLFKEISEKLRAFKESHPETVVIDLSIGNTTHPIEKELSEHLASVAHKQSCKGGYSGYGPENGSSTLRTAIAQTFYQGLVAPSDIFISDGTKCDLGRLQALLGPGRIIALQDPVYPAYRDVSIIGGASEIISIPCREENNFFPDIRSLPVVPDVLFICSPNNPTGTVLTKNQLAFIVNYALENESLIVFDTAYSSFISDPALPKSIFEIPGAERCAIEFGSFSKTFGFTGLRLGWSVVPSQLQYSDGSSVQAHWNRVISTLFNGASSVIQEAGIKALETYSPQGNAALRYYKTNANLLREALLSAGFSVFGGDHSPYLWVKLPENLASLDPFDFFLEEYGIAVTPGVGFGAEGKGFVRFSSFGDQAGVELACQRLASQKSFIPLGAL
ncbi:LL-diaminopimelate aminotransferase [Chlamydiifrater phoenicopteri]|uniref:LL-diaminopimelate aminotransferase n=1 Tax=Chlamydiifrater phoenicopteri TaxID=2681469 RepID=UPI001BCB8F95|nr:LL-diaminopimelate aminotransferase [Chlamydiifrater phoenicopteri]